MKRSLYESTISGLAAFAMTGALITAPGAARAQQAFAVVRPGDRAMTCEALATEINTLGQMAPAATADAKPKKRGGFGFLKVLGAAAPFVPGVGGIAGGVVSSVAMTVGSADAQGRAENQMATARKMATDAMAGGTPQQQRKERLTAIFDDKKC